jgi:hypothetical protein
MTSSPTSRAQLGALALKSTLIRSPSEKTKQCAISSDVAITPTIPSRMLTCLASSPPSTTGSVIRTCLVILGFMNPKLSLSYSDLLTGLLIVPRPRPGMTRSPSTKSHACGPTIPTTGTWPIASARPMKSSPPKSRQLGHHALPWREP